MNFGMDKKEMKYMENLLVNMFDFFENTNWKYIKIKLLRNGNYVVQNLNRLYGVLNMDGSILFQFEYKNIKHLDNGNYEVQDKNDLWGVLDKNGKVLIPVEYKFIAIKFNEDLEIVMYILGDCNNKYIKIDKNFDIIDINSKLVIQ